MATKLTKKQLKAQKFKDTKKRKVEQSELVEESNLDQNIPEVAPKEEKILKKKESSAASESSSQKEELAKKKRYIAFVGNLPFDCKKEDIQKLFSNAGQILSVRLLEDKQTKKSKGFAFVEFLDSASIQNALKMHHQTFMKRRINVELTAGGGGKSVNRIEKIRVKNDKHREQVSKSFKKEE